MGRPGQFSKGVSGNPKGRPKLPQEIHDVKMLARRYTLDCVDGLHSIATDEMCDPRARVAAMNSLLDRGFGKPKQEIDLDAHHYVGEEMVVIKKATE